MFYPQINLVNKITKDLIYNEDRTVNGWELLQSLKLPSPKDLDSLYMAMHIMCVYSYLPC